MVERETYTVITVVDDPWVLLFVFAGVLGLAYNVVSIFAASVPYVLGVEVAAWIALAIATLLNVRRKV